MWDSAISDIKPEGLGEDGQQMKLKDPWQCYKEN